MDVTNETLPSTLDILFANQPYGYTIKNKVVVLNKKAEATEKNKPPLNRPPNHASPQTDRQQTVSGTVQDSTGLALEGVTVTVVGTDRSTSTNGSGSYQIEASPGESLDFSIVGYTSQRVRLTGGMTTVHISLVQALSDLDEVVVVAFGTQKKVSVTGAIASIQTKEIKQSPAANLAVTLAGRLPGLTTLQRSGEPGRDHTALFLRGMGTLNATAPIILVDGVEREMTYIDPNEVESVTILKDASSTALFGVRGANGVILVTTKRGTSGQPSIGLIYERGLQGFTRTPSVINSYDWARLRNEAWANDNPNVSPDDPVNQPPYSEYALDRFMFQDYPEAYPNTNWQKLLFNDWVPQERYNLNINGGGDYVQYFVNVGYLNQGGQWRISPEVEDYDPSGFLKRYNFRSNIDAKLTKSGSLSTFLNAAGYFELVNSPNANTDEIFRRTYSFFPVVLPGPLSPDGEVLIGPGNYNVSPWALINRSGYRQETRNNIMASWGLKQDLSMLTEGLSAKFMTSFDTRTVYSLTAGKEYQRWIQLIDPNTPNEWGVDKVEYRRMFLELENTPLSISSGSNFQSFFNFQLSADYNRVFNEKHSVTGMLLAQQEQRVLPNDRLPFNLRGVALRAIYGYDNKYFAEFNAGYNGSEQFAKGRRYGFFPTVSAGWVVSNESFLKDHAAINLLKIRGSYGRVGSDRLGGRRFLYLDDIQRQTGGGYSPSLGRGGKIGENYIGNPAIQWEVAQKANLGIELGLFNEWTLTADFFHENRDNILINRQTIPMVYGVEPNRMSPVNMGIVKNYGYEIELNYNKRLNQDWSILSKLNWNFARNNVEFSDELQLPEDFAYRYRQTGYRIGQVFGYELRDGYYANEQEIANEGLDYVGYTVRPGDFKYVDANNDQIVDERDMVPIGYSSVPEYTFGGAFNVSYRNFDLSFLFQGMFNVTQPLSSFGTFGSHDFRERHLAAWTPERAASGEEILYPRLSLGSSVSERDNNAFFIENRSFIRLKNAEIGYRLPSGLSKKIGASEVRFYVNGLNLITWDWMRIKDFDPEINNSLSYPVYQIFNGGLHITF
ncbi:TonB-dependent receptor [Sphingobacterium sp. Ka21]|uniref:TonB-dependent receptor n=2 Tax=Sphingobacterium pedocola TaxID=2082722 RepID=A0ABR9T9F2_9SPHI|nr:TonB-dependent receptor [Sphingobacterium pedocola]